MYLSIIIPLYNEESSIGILMEKLLELKLPDFVNQKEIIVVDDFSSDNSFKNAQHFAQMNPSVKLIRHEKNNGKGTAIKTGISHSTGDVFLLQDADLELSPDDIPQMLEAMEKLNVGLVNGSRYMAGVIRPLSSYKRYLVNRLFTFLTSIIINVKITDMACGYKLIKKELYERLFLREKRFGFEAELIIKALRFKRNNITEVPVQYFPRNKGEGKKFRNIDGLRILWIIIQYGLFRKK